MIAHNWSSKLFVIFLLVATLGFTTNYYYWLEHNNTGNPLQNGNIWINGSFPANTNVSFYVYYDSSDSSVYNNGFMTFDFFDDYNRTSLGSNYTNATNISVHDSALWMNYTINNYLYSNEPYNFTNGTILHLYCAIKGADPNLEGHVGFIAGPGTGTHQLTIRPDDANYYAQAYKTSSAFNASWGSASTNYKQFIIRKQGTYASFGYDGIFIVNLTTQNPPEKQPFGIGIDNTVNGAYITCDYVFTTKNISEINYYGEPESNVWKISGETYLKRRLVTKNISQSGINGTVSINSSYFNSTNYYITTDDIPPSADVIIINMSSPINTTYYTENVTITVNCSGLNTSYYLNITANNTLIKNTETIINGTDYSFSQNFSTPGSWVISATCWNESVKNYTSNIYFTMVQPLNVNLSSPTNTTYVDNATITVNCSGLKPSYYLNITANGEVLVNNYVLGNNTEYSYVQDFTYGGWLINATCSNGTTINISSNIYFSVIPPPLIVNLSSPENTTYGEYVNVTAKCLGTKASYYLNITANGVLLKNNEIIMNNTDYTFEQNFTERGMWLINATCANKTSNISETIQFAVNYPSPIYNITECGVINVSGNYVLKNNLTGSGIPVIPICNCGGVVPYEDYTCLKITVPNVDIDCQGYSMRHNDSSVSDGIVSNDTANNLSVHGCFMENYQQGIHGYIANNSHYYNNTMNNITGYAGDNAGEGIRVSVSLWSIVYNNTIHNSGWGVVTSYSSNTIITNNTLYDNGGMVNQNTNGNICLFRGDNTTVYNNVLTYGKSGGSYPGRGITLEDHSNAMIYNNTILHNAGYGIWIWHNTYMINTANNNKIFNNTIANNTQGGLYLQSYGYPSLVSENLIYNNNFTGSSIDPTAPLVAQDFNSTTNLNYYNTTKDCTKTNYIGGQCIGGNYYSDFNGMTLGDGIAIGANRFDGHSLTDVDSLPLTNIIYSSNPNSKHYSYWVYCNITNTTGAQINYTGECIIDTQTLISEGKVRSDCFDIQPTDSRGIDNYWYQRMNNTCNTTQTRLRINIPQLNSSGTTTIRIYYDYPSISNDTSTPGPAWPQYISVWLLDGSGKDSLGQNDLEINCNGSGNISWYNNSYGVNISSVNKTNRCLLITSLISSFPLGEANFTFLWKMEKDENNGPDTGNIVRWGKYATNREITIRQHNDTPYFIYVGDNPSRQSGMVMTPFTEWNNFAINTSNGSSITTWMNGNITDQTLATVANNLSFGSLDIMGNTNYIDEFNSGSIRDMRLMKGSPTAGWVESVHNEYSVVGEENFAVSLLWVSPSPPNNINNFTYGLTFNFSANTNITDCSIEIDGHNKTGTIAPNNLSCSYTLTAGEYVFNNTYDIKGYGNAGGYYETDILSIPYYGCGYVNGNGTLLNNISINGANCLTINDSNLLLDGAGFTISSNHSGTTAGINLNQKSNTTFRNLNIRDFYNGILQGDNTVSPNGLYIINNTMYNVLGYGIYLSNCSGAYIENNTIYNSEYRGSMFQDNTSNIIFSNNILHNITKSGLSTAIMFHYNNVNITISNNKIYDVTNGIEMGGKGINTTIINNTIYNATVGAILSSNFTNFTNNNVSDVGRNCIYAAGSEMIINNNIIYSCSLLGEAYSGISVEKLFYSKIINNTVYDVWGDGFSFLNSSNLLIENNTAYSNTFADGMYPFPTIGTVSNITFVRNIAYNNSFNGFIIEDNPNFSYMNGNGFNFIFKTASEFNFTDNVAYNNSLSGFNISDITSGSFYNNTAYRNTQYGIYINSSSNINLTNAHLYNNTIAEIKISTNATISSVMNMTNLTIDNPYGDYINYTSLDIEDILDASSSYIIKYTRNESELPTNYTSFNQKFVNISTAIGAPIIDSISFRWEIDELIGYNENRLHLLKYNGTWSDTNAILDTSIHQLTATNLNPQSDYGILQITSCICPSPIGNWEVDISEECTLNSLCNISGYNISFYNSGNFTINNTLIVSGILNFTSGKTIYVKPNGTIYIRKSNHSVTPGTIVYTPRNAGMEVGDPPTNWSYTGGVASRSDIPHTGSYSINISRTGTAATAVYQNLTNLNLTNGTTYVAVGWVYIPSGQTQNMRGILSMGSGVSTFDKRNKYGNATSSNDTDVWMQINATFTYDNSTDLFFVILADGSNITSQGNALWDDVGIYSANITGYAPSSIYSQEDNLFIKIGIIGVAIIGIISGLIYYLNKGKKGGVNSCPH